MGHKIGYCAQTNVYIDDFTVKENLVFMSKLQGN